MKARNLASPQETLRTDQEAGEAASVLSRYGVRAVLVVDPAGSFAGVISDSELLRRLLPAYVTENEALARVLEEGAAEALQGRLEGLTVADLMPGDREEYPVVDGEDTLVEVAATMVRSRASLVGVVDEGRLIGGISIDDLVSHLLRTR
ncbi:MAG TPA: CBS domain-containing protein [Actinomycetota bacterium]|nr:CBS domain-containing protein [Actinomycetota bacterium]